MLGTCPVNWHERWQKGRIVAACLGGTRGGTVFTSGSTDWVHGLAGKDTVLNRITRNVMD